MTPDKRVEEILPTEDDLVKVGEHYWGGDYEPTWLELTRLKASFADILTPKIEKTLTQYHQDLMSEVVERIDEWENEARTNGEMKLISDLKQHIIKSK